MSAGKLFRLLGINLQEVRCPQCSHRMPTIRRPDSLTQAIWGGWTCGRCGCRMNRWGEALEPARSGPAQ